jgi:hypothetical protein
MVKKNKTNKIKCVEKLKKGVLVKQSTSQQAMRQNYLVFIKHGSAIYGTFYSIYIWHCSFS